MNENFLGEKSFPIHCTVVQLLWMDSLEKRERRADFE